MLPQTLGSSKIHANWALK
jgi:hypothetical protein